jgi:hypothetical protein
VGGKVRMSFEEERLDEIGEREREREERREERRERRRRRKKRKKKKKKKRKSTQTRMPGLKNSGKRKAPELTDDAATVAGVGLDLSVAAGTEAGGVRIVKGQADLLGAEPWVIGWPGRGERVSPFLFSPHLHAYSELTTLTICELRTG